MTPGETRVVFMGSPAFAVPSLQALVRAGYQVTLAVTQPDRPAGRGAKVHQPDVKVAALELGIDVFQPESLRIPETQERLAAGAADVFVVAAYGKILPRAVLAMPRKGCVNVHASLLPRWRGPSPIVAAILAGDAETGVSIMELEPAMDTGPVIARSAVPIPQRVTAGELEPALARLGADLLVEVLPAWLSGDRLAEPQDEALATYCSLLKKTDGYLGAAMTLAEAERAVRAFNPWPTASVEYRGGRLNVWRARAVSGDVPAAAGTMGVVERSPAVAFDGGWLVLDEVQKTGGKRMGGQAFLNGERGTLPERVGLA
ncbi:MAG: methionyl-tRNA formyltransferase [Tepidiformaceae bacterium]